MTTENPENVVEFESYGGTSETMVNDSPVTIKTLARPILQKLMA